MATTNAHVKGSALREFLLWYEREEGLATLRARLEARPAEERRGLALDRPAFGILANQWYEAPVVHAILDGVTHGLTEVERDRLAREGTRAATDAAIRGIYRLVFERIGTPERYASNIPRLWKLLHDTGARRIEIVRPGEAISTTEDWAGHHEFLCRVTVETMARLFEKMGCSRVSTTQLACVAWGDDYCESKIHWRPEP